MCPPPPPGLGNVHIGNSTDERKLILTLRQLQTNDILEKSKNEDLIELHFLLLCSCGTKFRNSPLPREPYINIKENLDRGPREDYPARG